MSTTTTTGTLAAGSSKTFTLAPGAAVSLTLSPNPRVTITETPESVSGSGVGGNTTRVHEPQLPGTFAYGPYAMGGVVVVAVASNSGSSVAWTRKDTVVTTSADGTSLVSGDGTPISFAGPAYTWVNRPAAASNAGMVIRITDIGPTGFGSMWMSDGTNWRTLTGRQVIASARGGSPTTALSTATAYAQRLDLPAGQLITSGALVLPNGMMRVGVGLEINAFIRHTGTAGTWGAVFRIGTANASGDSALVQAVGSATNDQAMWAFMEANVSSVTGITTGFNMQPQAAASGGSLAERTTNINFAAQMYLGVYINALTPPDTVQLISYSIALLD